MQDYSDGGQLKCSWRRWQRSGWTIRARTRIIEKVILTLAHAPNIIQFFFDQKPNPFKMSTTQIRMPTKRSSASIFEGHSHLSCLIKKSFGSWSKKLYQKEGGTTSFDK